MSAFHRVDDVRSMPAARFVNFAIRLPAYKGILRALLESEQVREARGDAPAPTPRPNAPVSQDARQNRTVPSDAGTLSTDPGLRGLIETRAS